MFRVANKKCIRRLSDKSLKAARLRNTIAVLAITLTTVLFTSLFTIVSSINYSFQQQNFRQAGGDNHGTFKDVTDAQIAELEKDPLIVESFSRKLVGMVDRVPPFNKAHIEVSHLDEIGTKHFFITPVEGSLPREGTDEAMTDTRVLGLLGIEPKIGAKFTIPIGIDDNTARKSVVERTFTLSGWWEYDSAIVASHVILPRSATEELCALSAGGENSMTGRQDLNVMFKSSLHIKDDMHQVLENCGYQSDDATAPNYIAIGVNWGYSGAQLSANMDITTVIAIVVMLLLIIFTGYLIIYNVFQISVSSDIRFYGLLKTIGTTGKQIRHMIRRQAYFLSLAGIPIGLILGFLIGNKLTPVIMAQLSYKITFVSFNPFIFIGATIFSLITVRISCRRPGRMAARVSPVEAVRYTEGAKGRKKPKKRANGAKLHKMAWANLGRSRGKTGITIISLTLAVVLMEMTYTFACGFDMDKYLLRNSAVDFTLGDAAYFQTGVGFHSTDEAVTEDTIAAVNAQGGITDSGRIYGQVSSIQEFVTEDYYRQLWGKWNSAEILDAKVAACQRDENNNLQTHVMMYGMEDFPLSKMNVLEGDISALSDPTRNAIAAVYLTDDYNSPHWQSHWAKVGDKVRLRYVDAWEYYYTDTGEIIPPEQADALLESGSERNFGQRATQYRDVEYEVVAAVTIPGSLDYRYYSADQFILGAEQFKQDTGTDAVMTYVFDTEDAATEKMENFLEEYTNKIQTLLDYESKRSVQEDFEGFRQMFLVMGSALSFIIGLVGVLNFINAILTGIITRKHEFAILQAIGMTGKQLKKMLMLEGLYYALAAIALSTALTIVLGPIAGNGLNSVFWFFTYRFTILPILILLPVFVAFGLLIPLVTYQTTAKQSIVERIRSED